MFRYTSTYNYKNANYNSYTYDTSNYNRSTYNATSNNICAHYNRNTNHIGTN